MDLHRLLRSLTLLAFLLATYFSTAPARHHGSSRHRHGHGGSRGGGGAAGRHKRQHRRGDTDPLGADAATYAHNVTYLPGSFMMLDGGGGGEESGDWGPWSEPSDCSRSCGGGVAFQTRGCRAGECIGGAKRYFSCNIQDCPDSSRDFREEQCASFNDIPFEGRLYQWVPYTKAPNKCELNCMPQGDRFYFRHRESVIDGTRCEEEKLDVCVEGQCLPVGCDMMLGSTAREDKCRECRGDGSSCRTIHGVLEMDKLIVGYNDILLIPAGATNIRVEEQKASNNYLAIRNVSNHYYLNGYWRIDVPGSYKFAGTVFHYERKPYEFSQPETITALGPTTEPLYIVLLYQLANPGVTYEYSIHKGATGQTDPDSYAWIHDEFTECSASCGGGFRTRNVTCVSRNLTIQPGHLCNPVLEPKANESCNNDPCSPEWVEGDWAECSQTCGEGGTQTRQVHCEQIVSSGIPSLVDEEKCLDLYGPKPSTTRDCEALEPCPLWHVGPWKPCDHLCGDGNQKRRVRCYRKVDGVIEVLPDAACPGEKPEEDKPCNLRPCEGVDWVTSEWSECEGKCGLQYKTRKVYCASEAGKIYSDEYCNPKAKPETTIPCDTFVKCDYEWFASQWSECSAECGTGIKTRKVFCGTYEEDSIKKVEDDKCDPERKYEAQNNCTGKDVCTGQWHHGPWSSCSKKCGGGTMTRKVFCFIEGEKVEDSKCDPSLFPFASTACNNNACSDDEMMPVEPTHSVDEDEEEEYDCDTSAVLIESTLAKGPAATDSSFLPEGSGDVSVGPEADELSSIGTPFSSSVSESLSTVSDSDLTSKISSDFTSDDVMLSDGTGYYSDSPATSSFSEEGSGASTLDEKSSEFETKTEGSTSEVTSESEGSSTASSLLSSSDITTEEISTTDMSSSASESSTSDLTTEEESSGTTESTFISSVLSTLASAITDSLSVSPSSESDDLTTESTDSSLSTTTESSSDLTTVSTESETTDVTKAESEQTDSTILDSTPVPTDDDEAIIPEAPELPKEVEATSSESMISSTVESTTQLGSTEQTTVESTESASPSDSTTSATETSSESVATESSSASSASSVSGETEGSSSTSDATTLSSEGTIETSTSEVTTESSSSVSETSSESTISTEETETEDTSTGFSSTLEIFVTTPSPAEVAITKEQKVKKCRRKKKPKSKKPPCDTTEFGCCPDGITAASGPFSRGCFQPETCSETKYKCCPDGVSAATGPKGAGCPPSFCEQTLFGCCADGVSIAEGNDFEGCKDTLVPYDCKESEFGCCPDNVTPAIGPNNEGCFECEGSGECLSCSDTKFGCCPDNLRAASGPDFAGCEEGSGFGTTETSDCNVSEYGCCPDGQDTASGPHFEGCGVIDKDNCTASYFGCCKDGVSPALGPRMEGCELTKCDREPYGCCDDNDTPAHGPNKEGCCLNSKFGCCPDNILPALAPNLEGCGCQYSPYGCCPDNSTAARGPNADGCGCRFTDHGCCPNQYTPAAGPNFEGCPCHTHQFGCCPDGVSIARGPRNQGCGCEHSEFGCCSDGRTPALGPEQSGCDCASSKYGCCIDGVTDAQGEKFQGCDEIPLLAAEACVKPRERGPCREFTVKWFFDTEYGGCSRFWYGGCGGNDNRFKTKEECEGFCVQPTGRDACFLPKIEGPCEGYYPTWYYDVERKQCGQFIYSGCLGNKNKFETLEECEDLCVKPDTIDACEQPMTEGPCEGNFSRWYFDKESQTCQTFNYGGCKGNANNFISEIACHQQCLKPGRSRDYCSLPRAQGACSEHLPRWYFDASEQRCMPFYYSGCEGNANRFDTREACENDCPPSIVKDMCMLPAITGECHNYTERWYYNAYDVRCTQFYYGGCGGNENNFLTLQDCEQRCERKEVQAPEEEFRREYCFLSYDVGPCSDRRAQWYYDSQDGVCKQFLYGGCYGNQNRFSTVHECERKCGNSQDVCQLPKVVGPCDGYYQQWYFDQVRGECLEFPYGGCQGNGNRFEDKRSCEEYCLRYQPQPEPPQRPDVDFILSTQSPSANEVIPSEICSARVDPGPCREAFTNWYFNEVSGQCEAFIYGGCQGNANRFESEEQCERQCGSFKGQDVCNIPYDVGPCRGAIQKWYFDPHGRRCQTFDYGGCYGNGNRFSSVEECESVCYRREEILPSGNDTVQSNIDDVPSHCRIAAERCKELHCAYGVTKSVDRDNCEVCYCYDPCEGVVCPEGTSCSADIYIESSSGETAFRPACRHVNKEGICPQQVLVSGNCSDECNTDADCADDLKCCFSGCGSSCIKPAASDSERPERPYPEGEPPYIQESDSIVRAQEGNYATLKCDAFGNPSPVVTWKKGSTAIENSGSRHKILDDGSLKIINLYRQDAGRYVCTADNGVGSPATRETELEVTDPTNQPAEILGEEHEVVITTLGTPETLYCRAVGWPRPLITWWRGDRMLPLSSQVYEQGRDFSLLIRSVTLRNLGPFTCQAYNGLGRAASWTVTVKAFGPVYTIDPADSVYTKYLISPSLSARTPPPYRPVYPPVQPVYPQTEPPPRVFQVPVEANITLTRSIYPVGSDISIPCEVAGFPVPRVNWYKDENLLEENSKIQISESHRLFINQADKSDAGTYRCEAINEFGSSYSTISIIIEGVYIHPNCTDNPFFANCKLIVAAKYCTHKYYARFCCKSCTQAGQLPSIGPHLEPAGLQSRLSSFRRKEN